MMSFDNNEHRSISDEDLLELLSLPNAVNRHRFTQDSLLKEARQLLICRDSIFSDLCDDDRYGPHLHDVSSELLISRSISGPKIKKDLSARRNAVKSSFEICVPELPSRKSLMSNPINDQELTELLKPLVSLKSEAQTDMSDAPKIVPPVVTFSLIKKRILKRSLSLVPITPLRLIKNEVLLYMASDSTNTYVVLDHIYQDNRVVTPIKYVHNPLSIVESGDLELESYQCLSYESSILNVHKLTVAKELSVEYKLIGEHRLKKIPLVLTVEGMHILFVNPDSWKGDIYSIDRDGKRTQILIRWNGIFQRKIPLGSETSSLFPLRLTSALFAASTLYLQYNTAEGVSGYAQASYSKDKHELKFESITSPAMCPETDAMMMVLGSSLAITDEMYQENRRCYIHNGEKWSQSLLEASSNAELHLTHDAKIAMGDNICVYMSIDTAVMAYYLVERTVLSYYDLVRHYLALQKKNTTALYLVEAMTKYIKDLESKEVKPIHGDVFKNQILQIKGEDEGTCVICREDVIQTICHPCKHSLMCHKCADLYLIHSHAPPTCPLCRTEIESFLRSSWVQTEFERDLVN